MESRKDLAIIVKSIQFEERHRIVTAITQNHGMVTALAKNSVQSKRFGGALDLFAASDWIFRLKPHSDLAFIHEAQVRNAFENLPKDFMQYSLASTVTEFLLRIAPQNQDCPELFQLHANALFGLNKPFTITTKNPLAPPAINPHIFFLNTYLIKLLQWSGHLPQLGACLHCQCALETITPEIEVSCLVTDAAWLCPTCKTASNRQLQENRDQGFLKSFFKVKAGLLLELSGAASNPIRRALQAPNSAFDAQASLFRWIEALFIYHIPGFDQKPLKSLKFLGLESSLTS